MNRKQLHEFLPDHSITPESVSHKGEQRFKMTFDFDAILTEAVKQVPGRL